MDSLLVLNLAIAGVTLTLAGLLLVATAKELRGGKLSRWRSEAKSTAEHCGYALIVDDGIIVSRNGAFTAAWEYWGEDHSGMSEEHKDREAARINEACRTLGSGWVLHAYVHRAPATTYDGDGDQFPDPITTAIDAERRRYFAGMETALESRRFLTVTYLAPKFEQRGGRLLFGENADPLDVFKERLERLENDLGLRMRRLGRITEQTAEGSFPRDELVELLNARVTGQWSKIHVPEGVDEVDLVLGHQDVWQGEFLQVGDQHVEVVALEGFPVGLGRDLLEQTGSMKWGNYWWCTRYIFLDEQQSLKELGNLKAEWGSKVKRIRDMAMKKETKSKDENKDAKRVVDDAVAAIEEVQSQQVGGGFFTSVVVVMDKDPVAAKRRANHIADYVQSKGRVQTRVEDAGRLEAWLGSLPGHAAENVRMPWMNTLNLADLLPKHTLFVGEKRPPHPKYPQNANALFHAVASGRTPYRGNLHSRDMGNTLVFGPSGMGKSTLLAFLIAQFFRYPGMQVFAFDRGNSLYALAAAVKASTGGKSGMHYTVAGEDSPGFAPLSHLQTQSDITWSLKWLAGILELNGLNLDPEQRLQLTEELRTFRERGGRSLTTFAAMVQDKPLQTALHDYTVSGAAGHLFDAREDGLAESDFTVFEMPDPKDLEERFLLPVLTYLFRRVEKRTEGGRPTMVVLDEASTMWKNPVAREQFVEWLRNMRKRNCSIIMATQSGADTLALGQETFTQMLEFVSSRIFLPNPAARSQKIAPIYEALGVDGAYLEAISAARPQRDYFHFKPEGATLIELALQDMALAFCGVADVDDVDKVKDLERRFGDDWVRVWLKERAPHVKWPPSDTGTTGKEARNATGSGPAHHEQPVVFGAA